MLLHSPSFVVSLALLAAGPALATTIRVLVLEPTSDQVDKGVLQSVTSMISVELARQQSFEVISSDEVKKLAELEADKQSLGCSEGACLAELAGAMGARLVVFGDAAMLGTLVVLNLNVFDSAAARSVGRSSLTAKGLEDLPEKLPGSVKELMGAILAREAEIERVAAGDDAPPPPPPDNAPAPWMAIVGWGLVGTGAVVAAGGIGYDAVAVSSVDRQLNAFDFIGPAALVVGGGLVAGGLAVALIMGGSDA
jgi:hypothetical protein